MAKLVGYVLGRGCRSKGVEALGEMDPLDRTGGRGEGRAAFHWLRLRRPAVGGTEVQHQPMLGATPGDRVAMKVHDPVRVHFRLEPLDDPQVSGPLEQGDAGVHIGSAFVHDEQLLLFGVQPFVFPFRNQSPVFLVECEAISQV